MLKIRLRKLEKAPFETEGLIQVEVIPATSSMWPCFAGLDFDP